MSMVNRVDSGTLGPRARQLPRLAAGALVLLAALLPGPAPAQTDPATKQLMAANGLFAQGFHELAAKEYAAFLAAYPKDARVPSARMGLAFCRYHLGDYDQAAGLLAEALKSKDLERRDDALAVLGHCELVLRRYARALAALDELVARHPKSPHLEAASLNRAQALYFAGQAGKADAACREFLKRYPQSASRDTAEYFLGLSLLAQGRADDAAETARRLLEQHPKSVHRAPAMLLIGRALEARGRLPDAAEQFQKVIRQGNDEQQAEARYSLGVVLYKARNYPPAVEQFQAVLARHGQSPYAAAARMELGLAHLAAGDVGKAREALSHVAKHDPARAPKATYWLAQCDVAEGKHASARALLLALAKLKDPPEPAGLAYSLGLCAMAVGDHRAAADAFADFRKRFPHSDERRDAAYREAFCRHRLGDYAGSLALCEAVEREAKESAPRAVAELAAENLFLLGRYADAAGRFEKLAATAKQPLEKLRHTMRLGQCAYFRGDYKQAIARLTAVAGDKLAAGDEGLRDAVFFLGDAHLQAGQHKEAAALLSTYLASAPRRRGETLCKLAAAQEGSGAPDAAARTFAELLKGGDGDPWVRRGMLEYGRLMYGRGSRDEAAKALLRLLKAGPGEELAAPAEYLLAWIDFDARRYEPAASRLEEMAKRYPKHALAEDAAYQQAACLKEAGRHEQALAQAQAYLKAHPAGRHAVAARQLAGLCLAKLGRYNQAIDTLIALSKDKRTTSDAVLYELAWSQRKTQDVEGAGKTYRALLDTFPASKLATPARAELADLLYQKQDYGEAADLLERVARDEAAGADVAATALYRLGWCSAALGRHDRAAAAFSRFVQKFPRGELAPSAMYKAAEAFAELGKFPEAETHLKRLLADHARHDLAPLACLKLGSVQAQAERYDASAATYAEFLKDFPKSPHRYRAHFGLGWAAENRKRYDEARKWYAKVTAEHDGATAARAQFQIGECHLAEGRFADAARELLKVAIVYDYPQWSAAALYDAGRAFEQLGKRDEARRQYEACVQKYAREPAAALAKKRLEALGG